MKERPIIFNAEMVRAVLEERKTQTRRIMKVQPDSPNFGLLRITDSTKRADIGKYHWAESNGTGTHTRSALFSCPFGAVGDRLWVRETFSGHYLDDDQIQEIKDGRDKASDLCEYRADYPNGAQAHEGWTPSIHMPRWASRITLEITGVRVERLQDISESDAVAEGIEPLPLEPGMPQFYHEYFPIGVKNGLRCNMSATNSFRGLWGGICGADSWQANPWVWGIEFKRVANHIIGSSISSTSSEP